MKYNVRKKEERREIQKIFYYKIEKFLYRLLIPKFK